MKIFFDFEFDKDDRGYFPISLGATSEERHPTIGEFHCVFDYSGRIVSPWVQQNVIPRLPRKREHQNHWREFEAWCGPSPEFWANYGAYDWFLMCELFGGLMRLPESWPSFYNELQVFRRIKGKEEPPWLQTNAHNALADAEWNRRLYEWCIANPVGA